MQEFFAKNYFFNKFSKLNINHQLLKNALDYKMARVATVFAKVFVQNTWKILVHLWSRKLGAMVIATDIIS